MANNLLNVLVIESELKSHFPIRDRDQGHDGLATEKCFLEAVASLGIEGEEDSDDIHVYSI